VTTLSVNGHPAIQVGTSEIGKRVHLYVGNQADVLEVNYGLFAPQFLIQYSFMVDSLRFTP